MALKLDVCSAALPEPAPSAPVRLKGRMTPNGYKPENAAWKPWLTKHKRGHDPMKLPPELLTKAGHPPRSTRALVRAYGEDVIEAYRDIPAHCLDCSSGSASARRNCAVIDCPFWIYRITGQNPHNPRRGKKPNVQEED